MITYQVEKWTHIISELEPLFVDHWHEIALDHERVPLDVAHDKYADMCNEGVLHVVTARDDGKLVGYHVAIISGHLHYLSTLHGITDIYFILPQYRAGRVGLRLFQKVEQELKALGVKKLFTGCKLHYEEGRVGKLFEYLGYKETERLYTKYIGD